MGLLYDPAAIDKAVERIRGDLLKQADAWAAARQVTARQNAPWTDRGGKDSVTGLSARESLEGEAGALPNGDIQIILRSTRASKRPWKGGSQAPVGAFLELKTRKMRRKYDVIWPTLTDGLPDLKDRIEVVMRTGS